LTLACASDFVRPVPLFGRSTQAAEPLDARLEAHLPEKAKDLRKILRKEGAAILDVLAPGEEITFICNSDCAYATSVDMFAAIVVTDRRLLIVRKGRYQEFPIDEIRGVRKAMDTGCYKELVTVGFRAGNVNIHMSDAKQMWALFGALGHEPAF
jgi:hypothetical protein